MRERLLALKEEQQENRRLCGRSYIKDYLEYVCVNEIGDLIKPHYVTESFPKLLKAKGMRQIRYHDLRHSCASLLLANGVPMKQIQEWLGHSDFSTTANIYAHLDSRRNAQWLGLCSELKRKASSRKSRLLARFLAERVGFEPTEPCGSTDFESKFAI